jgi:ribosomal-protein-alanine N-acetyltransferase
MGPAFRWNLPPSTLRLGFRYLTHGDLDFFYDLDRRPEVMRYLGIAPLHSKNKAEETLHYLLHQNQLDGIGRLVVYLLLNQKPIGLAGFRKNTEPFGPYDDFLDFGFRFLPETWGKGLATEACNALMGELAYFKKPVYAMTDVRHHASERVLEKVGFKKIDQFVVWGDLTNWWEKSATQETLVVE